MSIYRTCPHCGAALDPGEVCEDCAEKEKAARCSQHRTARVDFHGNQPGKSVFILPQMEGKSQA